MSLQGRVNGWCKSKCACKIVQVPLCVLGNVNLCDIVHAGQCECAKPCEHHQHRWKCEQPGENECAKQCKHHCSCVKCELLCKSNCVQKLCKYFQCGEKCEVLCDMKCECKMVQAPSTSEEACAVVKASECAHI